MKARQYQYQNEHPNIPQWYEEIASNSSDEFSAKHVNDAVEGRQHGGFLYCTDDDEVVGLFVCTLVEVADGSGQLVILGAAGSVLDDWEEADSLLNELAVHYGCSSISIRGRKGFAKVFKQYGWEQQYVVLSRPVKPLE
jgi:hypothetical protein